MPTSPQRTRVARLAREHGGLVRAADARAAGIAPSTLSRMVERGELEHIARGLYALPDAPFGAHRSLLEATQRVPDSVVVLLSALGFHGLGTQMPHAVWLAVERGRKTPPTVERLAVRVVTMSPSSFAFGVEQHLIDGVGVPITSAAKTVADCFKYRDQVGLEVALEALRDYRTSRADTVAALLEAARVCRVLGVVRPYLEAIG